MSDMKVADRVHASGWRPMSAVRDDYQHGSKLIQPAMSITLGDSVLKWYDIAPADEPVRAELALALLARERAVAGAQAPAAADGLRQAKRRVASHRGG